MTTYTATSGYKTLTNLLTNGSFEGTGWSAGTYDTAHRLFGTRAIKLTGTTSTAEVTTTNNAAIAVNNTHKYYVRWYVYHEGAQGTTGCYFGIKEPSFQEGLSLGPANQWNLKSAVNTRPSPTFTTSEKLRFDFNNQKKAGSLWIDGGMVLDLTAIWGAGSEPTKQWLDANIPWFDGTVNLFIPSTPFKDGDVINIPYSGRPIAVGLKKGRFKLEVWGAQGGYRNSTTYAGKGGYAKGVLSLAEPHLFIGYAGGSGNTGGTAGGYNGGGRRHTYNGGGGGSDFRIDSDSLYARVLVAGGGGSDGSTSRTGGAGGGTDGITYSGSGYGTNNGPGHQTYSGSGASTTASSPTTSTTTSTAIYGGFGFGGNGCYANSGYGGAGGGGWYGGSGTMPDSSADDDKAGAGGSGYLYTAANVGNYPAGCLLRSDFYLGETQLTAGNASMPSTSGGSQTGQSGDGYCRITIIETGVTATWVADGQTVRTDTVEPGQKLTPPTVTKPGYDTSWTSNGVTINFATYTMPDYDVTFTAVFTPSNRTLTLYDAGTVTTMQVKPGAHPSLPNGTHGDGVFNCWETLDNQVCGSSWVMPSADTTIYARYARTHTVTKVNSVALAPNPVAAGANVLCQIDISATTSSYVWTDLTLTTGEGMVFSVPQQANVSTTTPSEPWAVFDYKGIKTAGPNKAAHLTAITGLSPRSGVWSKAISNSSGAITFTVTGTATTEKTMPVQVKSGAGAWITRATIKYTKANGTTATHTATSSTDTISFPSGTFKSFVITVSAISRPYAHVRILDVAPGGMT